MTMSWKKTLKRGSNFPLIPTYFRSEGTHCKNIEFLNFHYDQIENFAFLQQLKKRVIRLESSCQVAKTCFCIFTAAESESEPVSMQIIFAISLISFSAFERSISVVADLLQVSGQSKNLAALLLLLLLLL